MKPNRAEQFAADIYRYCPLAIVALATVANVGTFRAAAHHQMDATSVLARFALALLVATVAVRCLARLLVSYATRNVVDEQHQAVIDARTVDPPSPRARPTPPPASSTAAAAAPPAGGNPTGAGAVR